MSPDAPGDSTVPSEHRITEYWSWLAVALFMLVSVDLLTSLFAAADVGLGAEGNPWMGWLLSQSVTVIVAVHLTVLVLCVTLFYGLVETIRRAPPRRAWVVALSLEVWLGLLLTVGFLVFANNVSVIVLGRSLL